MNATTPPQATGWDVQPDTDTIEEGVLEIATIEELRGDIETLHKALTEIVRLDPTKIGQFGGPSHKHFGKKIILTLEKAKQIAAREVQAQNIRDYTRELRATNTTEEEDRPADEGSDSDSQSAD